MHSVELNMNWEWPAGNQNSGARPDSLAPCAPGGGGGGGGPPPQPPPPPPLPYRFAPSAPVSRRGDGYEMSSFTAAMTDCRPALASPNSICVLGSKYSSFSMPA